MAKKWHDDCQEGLTRAVSRKSQAAGISENETHFACMVEAYAKEDD